MAGTRHRRVRPDGYVDVWRPGHALARHDGYVFEHRLVAWEAGLLSDPGQQIHHLNCVKDDNRFENLAALGIADHARFHAEDRRVATNQYGTWPVKPRHLRQGAPRPARDCVGCSQPVPLTRRRDALYCSKNCRVRTWKRQERLRRRFVRARVSTIQGGAA